MAEFEDLQEYLPPPPQAPQPQYGQSQSYPTQSNQYNNQNNGSQYNSNYQRPANNGQYNRGYQNQGQRSNNFRAPEPTEPFQLYKPYVITGNKEAPPHILDKFSNLVRELESRGFTLRTGCLEGPDIAAETAVRDHKLFELYLPFKNFNGKDSKLYYNTPQSNDVARMFHPTFDGLKPAIQAFLSKNARMLLGKELKSPALCLICWSDDGVEDGKDKTSRTGNVGHVIAIASAMYIPVFNLQRPDAEQRLREHFKLNNQVHNHG